MTPLDNGPLQIAFVWKHDRWHHEVWWTARETPVRVAFSVEGNGEEDWPASPAYQQGSRERGADGVERAFLIGMAGRSHWSASIVPHLDGFMFDVACRVHVAPEQLGSLYGCDPVLGLTGKWGAAEGTQIAMDPAGIRIAPPAESPAEFPATIRWMYRVSVKGE